MRKKQGGRMLDQTSRTEQSECSMCGKDLKLFQKALFVEEEVCRTFCSEDCISEYYSDDIHQLEKKYLRLRGRNDLSGEERQRYSHLRWITLEHPDEIWCEVMPSGEYRYTLISKFTPEDKKVWSVCICLFLKGEPSFLYLAFPTQKLSLVTKFRRGEKVERIKGDVTNKEGIEIMTTPQAKQAKKSAKLASKSGSKRGSKRKGTAVESEKLDRLAEDWTENEGLRAKLQNHKNAKDIKMKDYGLFEHLADPTLETPDELWVQESHDGAEPDQYSFIRYFPNESTEKKSGIWYIITAQETEDSEQLELLTQIPTVDQALVQKYRTGRSQKILAEQSEGHNRFVH